MFLIFTKWKNTLSKRFHVYKMKTRCWSVFHFYKMGKDCFEAHVIFAKWRHILSERFYVYKMKNTSLRRFDVYKMQNMFVKRFSCLQNQIICFWNDFIFSKWKNTFLKRFSRLWNENTFLKPLHVYKKRKILVFEACLCLQDEKDVYEACFISTESNKLVFWSDFMFA